MAVHFRLKPYILVFLVVTSTVSIIQAARTSGAVLSYEFLHKECTKGSLSGTNGAILGNFVGVQQSPNCPPSNGLTGKTSFVVSTLNVSKIATLLDQDFTLELWLRPSIRMNEGDTILAIADQNGGISSKGCNFDMKIVQSWINSSSLTFSLVSCYGQGISTGKSLSTNLIHLKLAANTLLPALVHLVARISYASYVDQRGRITDEIFVDFSINGIRNAQTEFYTPRGGYPINSVSAGPWNGSLFLLAAYGKSLTDAEILNNYHAGLIPSDLFLFKYNISVQENGEAGVNTKPPEFYTKTIPTNDLAIVKLEAYSLNYDVGNPGRVSSIGDAVQLYLYSSPSKAVGTLYYMNGSEIQPDEKRVPIDYNWTHQCFCVRYRPPLNIYSSPEDSLFMTLIYGAYDTTAQKEASESGKVGVIITHVNKPPVLIAIGMRNVLEGKVTNITIEGHDIDSVIAGVQVLMPPKYGSLYLRYTNGTNYYRIEKYPFFFKDSFIGITGSYSRQFYLTYSYRHYGAQPLMASDGSILVDTMPYRLVDSESRNNYSIVGNLLINVSTSLSATSSNPIVLERSSTELDLYADDAAEYTRSVAVRLLSLPPNGWLFDINQNQLRVGSLIQMRPTTSTKTNMGMYHTSLIYIHTNNNFTTPTLSWNGRSIPGQKPSFDFQYCIVSSSNLSSLSATERIRVQNVNDPTILNFTLSDDWDDNRITVRPASPSDNSDRSQAEAVINGFEVFDVDKDTDVIKVKITINSDEGPIKGRYLSLNADFLMLVDFNSDQYCRRGNLITCAGDGAFDSNMIFVGPPSAVQKVLNGMIYQSQIPNIVDNITIVTFDGEGGECLTNEQLGPGSVRRGCFQAAITLQVYVGDYTGVPASGRVSNVSNGMLSIQLQYVAVGIVVSIVLLVIRCCCCSRKENTSSNYYVENRNLNDKTIGQRVADKGGIRIILTCFLCLITSTFTLFLKCCCCASFQNGHKDSNSDLDNMEKQLKILKHYRTGTEGKDKGSSKDMQRREYSAYRSKVQRKNDDEIRRPQKVYKHCKSTLTHGTKNQLAQSNYRRERPSNMHEVGMDADDSDRVYCSPWTRHRHRSGKIYYYNNRTKQSTWNKPKEFQ